MKKIRFKCWVQDENEKLYGPGPHELIKRILKEGSLSKATEQMNMSYKKGWDIIQRLNQSTENPLVILKKGGVHGGGAEVTSKGKEVIEKYEKFEKEVWTIAKQQQSLIEALK